ncbi:M18 family aminopeptidase [Actinospica durhamensis]|uniref:Probable M18 family aminopeptidase 2 n=1 Tax=Actinospica durhamensis TaxID=1508375 RepID=A0A941ILE4_9ACTN|nr:M18 family aminopeptidase [Actinospica durhamensis]MBR7831629.1 M18 family aminopeptidase [Actinospica durhamensis]
MATTFDRTHTDDLLAFLRAAPTPFHAVAEAAARLERAGFTPLSEAESWTDAVHGARYVIRSGALVAWYLPADAPAERPLRILGSHTDSPNLRVKPAPDVTTEGWRQVAVEVYGGPLFNSWLDRDLGLAGRLVLRDGSEHLVNIDRPLLRVPQLAVHLDRGVNGDGLKLNPQQHLRPIWGVGESHDGDLIAFVAAEHNLRAEDVLGWDLMTYDVTAPAYLGRDADLVASGRLDNLMSVHASVAALTAAVADGLDPQGPIPVLAAMDHEETGSDSAYGAGGPFLETVLDRLLEARGGRAEARARAYAGSFVASADMAHAVHPNYPEKHEPGHRPRVNGGPALKMNVNQRYATNGRTQAVWARACAAAGIPTQSFVSRNDLPCGTTIGPITATRLGIETFDVGVPSLSMHSARELCGADDPWRLAAALKAFLEG